MAEKKPIVYSCSGCSNVAQAANTMAVRLDRSGVAEMSCIAGVAAGVPSLVRTARSKRPILAIDGCPLACVKTGLAQHDLKPDAYLELSRYGLKKRQHEDIDEEQIAALMEELVLPALHELNRIDAPKAESKSEES